jgi:MFS family permease
MTLSLLATAILLSGFLIGLIPTLVDNLKKSWQMRLNVPAERSEWGVWLFYFTWLPAMPLTGVFIDHGHPVEVLFFGLLGLILGLAWLAMVRSFSVLLGVMALLGCAYSLMTVSAIQLMTSSFFEDGGKHHLAAMNLGFILVGLGALVGPGVLALMERWWGYRQGLLYLSLSCIVPAALAAVRGGELLPTSPSAVGSWEDMLTNPHLAMLAGVVLLYFAIENCFEFWPEPYLQELGYENRSLRGGMLLFWFAFIASRAVAAWWLYGHPGQGIAITLILVVVSAMIMGNLAGGYEVGSGSIGLWLAGAFYGPLLPCLLGIVFDLFPNLPAGVLGILLALSGLDTLIVRPLMRLYSIGRPARTIMRVPIVLALLMAAPLFVLLFRQ